MSEQKHTCQEMSRGSAWNRYACGKPAKLFEKKWGKEQWFCGLHAPSVKLRRREERRAERERVMGPIWDAEAKAERVRAAAPELLESAKAVIAWFEALKQEQYERTVLGQTLESAAENWNKPSLIEGSLDLEPLMKAIAKAEGKS